VGTWTVWLIALTWSVAVASSPVLPPNTDVFLTTEVGTIVGVGTATGSGAFEIRILEGFSGPARLTLVAPGAVSVFDVMVRGRDRQLPEGDLQLLDGTSVLASWRSGGVVVLVVWSEAPAAAGRAPGMDGRAPGMDGRAPGIEGSNASETGRENANPRASEGGNPSPGEANPRSGEENPGRRP
jgi:hypothetical protein